MKYREALRYFFSFLNYERLPFDYNRALNLKRMETLAGWFHHPERRYPSVLIAGTKGKGSTASFLSSILSAHDFKTGLYTSPHLITPRERIRINGKAVSEREFANIFSEIKKVLDRKKNMTPFGAPTFFEVFTLAAMIYFAKEKVDVAVFEVGMGGRLDATNILNPEICVITPVSMDHQEHLGGTLSKIAGEKAGIIKKQIPVIVGPQKPDAKKVILKKAGQLRSEIFSFGSFFRVSHLKARLDGTTFHFHMKNLHLKGLTIKLPGLFQPENAATAIAAALLLGKKMGFSLNRSTLQKGLLNASWAGRFEIVKRQGRVYVLDGAHNDASAAALALSLKQLFKNKEIHVILGTSREKDIQAILSPLIPITTSFIMTKSDNVRAREPKSLLEALYRFGFKKNAFWAVSTREALALSKKIHSKKSIVVMTGSLFLVGEARELLKCPLPT